MEVPEFPQSSAAAGSCNRPRPPSMTKLPSACRSTPAPMASTAATVAATSAPSDRPTMTDRPSAKAANITARCEIDFSPGVRTDAATGHAAVHHQYPGRGHDSCSARQR